MKRATLVVVVAIIIALHATTAPAIVSFERSVADSIFAGTSFPRAVCVADVGGGSELDIIVALSDFGPGTSDRVVWYQNDGAGLFTEFIVDSLIVRPISLDVGDIDGDLDVDILVGTDNDGAVYLYVNNASVFTRATIDGNIVVGRTVKMADIDGDTDVDIAALYNNGVYWYENDGAEVFTKRTVESLPITDIGLAVTPFDFDEDMDIVTAVYNPDSMYSELVWYENDGSENFSRHVIGIHPTGVSALDVADIDGMGYLDVVACSQDADDVILFSYGSALILTTTTIDANFNRFPRAVRFVDLDNDSDEDVVVTGGLSGTNEIVYYENDGALTFVKRPIEALASTGYAVCVQDVDGDTRPDIVAAMAFPPKLLVYDNRGTATSVDENNRALPMNLAPNYPNPFNPSTTISFALPSGAHTRLDVLTARGQRVRGLVARQLPAGPHRVAWDGRDDAGRTVVSGIYFCRLQAGAVVQTRKMVLMK